MQMGRSRYDMKILDFYFWVQVVPTLQKAANKKINQSSSIAIDRATIAIFVCDFVSQFLSFFLHLFLSNFLLSKFIFDYLHKKSGTKYLPVFAILNTKIL